MNQYFVVLTNPFTHKNSVIWKKRGADFYSLPVGSVQSAPCLFIKIKNIIILHVLYCFNFFGTKHNYLFFRGLYLQ
jgi:hypothetical protein